MNGLQHSNLYMKKKTILYCFLLIIFIYLLILIGNYFLGTNRIINAHQIRSCEVCQSCIQSIQPICNSKSGFDIYYLYLGLLVFTFIIGFINVILDKKLVTSILIVLISAISYLVITEIIIKIFAIPVLYTHFQEGYQWLSFGAFSELIELNIFLLFFSVISSLIGNIIGLPFLLVKRRFFKE